MAGVPFAAKSFCAFAASLTERWRDDSAAVRTTMSRAYYGALIEARNARGISTRGQGGHQRVIDAYEALGTKEGDQIARDLKTLRDFREAADYEPNTPCDSRQAFRATQHANKVLLALGIQPEPDRPKLVQKDDPATPSGAA